MGKGAGGFRGGAVGVSQAVKAVLEEVAVSEAVVDSEAVEVDSSTSLYYTIKKFPFM